MQIYIVQSNDTVDKIADSFFVPVQRIIYDNQLIAPYRLAIGQALLIQEGNETGGTRNAVTGGYAYPFIRSWVLEASLPFLSELYIFSYGFTAEGKILPPKVEDKWMIHMAQTFMTKPILVLTPLDEEGKFSNYLIHTVINDTKRKERLIQELLQTVTEKGFLGVDIDFEYILAEDREAFAAFVGEVKTVMNENGYQVSVALVPKTERNQSGLLYEGMDYALLGEAANQVFLMTYEWGYTYGPPMAVAPLLNVKKVVEYAVTEIPKDKIKLGIPNYGYDWPLPYEQGVTAAKSIGNIEAIEIAIQNNAVIQFDEQAQSPFFTYTLNGIDHIVWFEDVRSLQAKFNLIDEFELKGAGYWQIMRLFRANWLLLAENFAIQK